MVVLANTLQPLPGDPTTVLPALRSLRRGERLVYHEGTLHKTYESSIIAREVMDLYRDGVLVPVQRRLGLPRKENRVDWQALRSFHARWASACTSAATEAPWRKAPATAVPP